MNEVKGCLAIAGVFCLLIVVSVLGVVCNYTTRLYEQTASPEVMIERYEWFEQQYRDIKAVEGQIKDSEEGAKRFKADLGPSKDWPFDVRQEYDRLNSIVVSLKAARRGMVETYNARASMITRNLWKRGDLPHHIDQE